MQNNMRTMNEPLSEVSSMRPSRRPSSIHRRKSSIAGHKVLYIPFRERLFIILAAVIQVIILALLIASATTDVFEVDGTRAIESGANLTHVTTALGVTVTAGSKPFCYSLWGARHCGKTEFHTEKWYAARGAAHKGFPSPVSQTMMLGAAAFAVLAACYSFLNLCGIVVVVFLQDYTAVLCAWSFSVWITILISWALSVGVYARGMTTMPSSTIPGRLVHVKDYCRFTTSFGLTMACFALHAFQFAFTVVYERMFAKRMRALVKEQKQLTAEVHDQAEE
ncbi:hypothetical protein ABB37_07123 [Leptomonas pyrrhocoris]|uniref:Uncharacterized protein n=1 Tax=Leptomonas pyrrhocoris TaxID=157538 RepID=A0A0M9FW05_LEPPY|nr:hypothetical protein ABB37_07123 [Leptomonas pyrrhocoris]KPA77215.1 hypothetical protein ABB37_07123 [Leptomonas pyrrhocoris]|eukprot:XP_015655654.1 hypothetical protein ABB37_07123 [Leptomonas pyrrhocoris]